MRETVSASANGWLEAVMASTVRVSARTCRMLHELAAATGRPLRHVLDEAV
jgi:hypothetical protein